VEGPSASELNDPVEDLLFSRWGSNRKVRFSLDLPDLSNSCMPIEQGHDLLIGGVYLLSARRKSSCGV
jgi:hypothetical protein